MNVNQIRKKNIYVNVEVIFDFRSYLFALARYANSKLHIEKHLNQSYFDSLKFKTINEFINCISLKSEDTVNYENYQRNNIINNKIFLNVKPRLYSLSEILYLCEYDINSLVIYSREEYYLEIMEKMDTIKSLADILNLDRNSITLENFDIFYEKVLKSDTCTDIVIDFDTESETFNKFENSQILFYLKSKKTQISECPSQFEEFLGKLNISCENFNNFIGNEFIYKFSKKYLDYKFRLLPLWRNYSEIDKIEITGEIIGGFKRGSKLLGVPTANLFLSQETLSLLQSKINGVYYGRFKFKDEPQIYKGVLSIGYNPYFDNETKTVEVFLINYDGEDFYGKIATLSIEGYIRAESSFENFSELVSAIAFDIIVSNDILNIIN